MKTPAERLADANARVRAASEELAVVTAPINERLRVAVGDRELALQAGMSELTGLKVGDRYVADRIEYEVESFLFSGWGPLGHIPTMPTKVEEVMVRSRRILKDGTKGNSTTATSAAYVIAAVKARTART